VIPASATDAIYDYVCLHEGYTPLFYSLSRRNYGESLSLRSYQRIVTDAYDAAGVIDTGKPKTAHSLRHTAISNAINNGAPLPKVQSMARHANIATTMIYFHEIDRIKTPAEDFIDYTPINADQ
jgi:integrase/recombinase XerD